jgi:hypothetical protein
MRPSRVMALLVCAGLALAQEKPADKGTGDSGVTPSASQTGQATAVPMTAEEIMGRVAENQDRAVKLRAEYVYQQRIHIVLKKPHGRLVREETADYQVVPSPDGMQKDLQKITGRYRLKGKYQDFEGLPIPEAGQLDADLIRQFRDDFANAKSKDGLAEDLFPLTSEQQKDLVFGLMGEEAMDGRQAYRVAFRPKDKDDLAWAGDAWIDKEELEPIYVATRLSRKVPLAIRTLLGTDLPGWGFSVHYRRQADGVWFPTAFGSECELRVLFFFNRDIAISLDNREFEHTHVKAKINLAAPE